MENKINYIFNIYNASYLFMGRFLYKIPCYLLPDVTHVLPRQQKQLKLRHKKTAVSGGLFWSG